MLFVLSGALIAFGIVLLVVGVLVFLRPLRRFHRTSSMVTARTQDQLGLLRARKAAVRVAIAERRNRHRGGTGSTNVATIDRES